MLDSKVGYTPAPVDCPAGDHLKSAADAGLDLVGCTPPYREGYVHVNNLDAQGKPIRNLW